MTTDPNPNTPPVDALAPIAFLLGTWRGEGRGFYPTIAPFDYGEEIRFWHTGKPFLAYTQRTWSLEDGRGLHAEMGYWRARPEGRVEVTLAHPTGVCEILEGTVSGSTLALATTSVTRTTSAKEVTALRRVFEYRDGVLRYTLQMAAVGEPLQDHLLAELRRVE